MENDENLLILASTRSTIVSLDMVRLGKAGLDEHRQSVLNRVSKQYSWAIFGKETLKMIDLAYLTAKTGDEFAILSGKRDDILFHGDKLNCDFEKVTELKEMLIMHKYLVGGENESFKQQAHYDHFDYGAGICDRMCTACNVKIIICGRLA